MHLHQLGCALGLPRVLLLARELHAHRLADRARQQGGVGRHIVGAVAAVATRGLHADHINLHIGQTHQAGQIGAQHMRTLAAGPDLQAIALPIGQGARGPDGRVHLVGPDVVTVECLRSAGQGSIDITIVHQRTPGRGVVAQGLGQIVHRRQARPGFPAHTQFAQRLLGMFFSLGDDADKVTDDQQLADAGNVGNRGFVHRLQRVADEVAMIGAGVRRAHHTAVQHAGHAHVVHKHQLTSGLGRYVHARRTGADHAVIGGRLERRAKGQCQLGMLPGQ